MQIYFILCYTMTKLAGAVLMIFSLIVQKFWNKMIKIGLFRVFLVKSLNLWFMSFPLKTAVKPFWVTIFKSKSQSFLKGDSWGFLGDESRHILESFELLFCRYTFFVPLWPSVYWPMLAGSLHCTAHIKAAVWKHQ